MAHPIPPRRPAGRQRPAPTRPALARPVLARTALVAALLLPAAPAAAVTSTGDGAELALAGTCAPGDLLGAELCPVLDDAVDAVVGAAAPVVQGAVEAAAPVVEAAAPVVEAAAPVADAVEDVLAPATEAVEQVAPVGEVAEPVVEALAPTTAPGSGGAGGGGQEDVGAAGGQQPRPVDAGPAPSPGADRPAGGGAGTAPAPTPGEREVEAAGERPEEVAEMIARATEGRMAAGPSLQPAGTAFGTNPPGVSSRSTGVTLQPYDAAAPMVSIPSVLDAPEIAGAPLVTASPVAALAETFTLAGDMVLPQSTTHAMWVTAVGLGAVAASGYVLRRRFDSRGAAVLTDTF